jgi:hypothetical protein
MENNSAPDLAAKIALCILEKYEVGKEQPSVFDEPPCFCSVEENELAKLIREVIKCKSLSR